MKIPKNDNLKLAKRLSGYASAAGALMVLSPAVKGQIEYSGLKNIDVFPNEILDLDKNSVNDFVFHSMLMSTSYDSMGTHVYLLYGFALMYNFQSTLYQNSWMIRSATQSGPLGGYVHGLAENAMVDASAPYWTNTSSVDEYGVLNFIQKISVTNTTTSYYYNFQQGDFNGNEAYVGIRFQIGSEVHYGWIRALVSELILPVTIIDWAYNTVPDEGITTGFIMPEFNYETFYTSEEVTIGLTFDAPVSGIEPSDFMVDGGSISNVSVISSQEYDVTIQAAGEGIVTVELPVNSAVGTGKVVGSTTAQFIIHNLPTSIESEITDPFRMYPNPVQDVLNIVLENRANVDILNVSGELLMSRKDVMEAAIDVSQLSPGIYMIRIWNNNTSPVTQKFIKE